jgi:hypothetical protein
MLKGSAPPFLIIREGVSFWVDTRPLEHCTATPQAFREGCFQDAWCYDVAGAGRPIIAATMLEPSTLDKLSLWKQFPVQLTLGSCVPTDLDRVASKMAVVLRSDNEFCELSQRSREDHLAKLKGAQTMADLIEIARAPQA